MRVIIDSSVVGTTSVGGQTSQGGADAAQVPENSRARPDKVVRPVTRINGTRIHFRELALMAWPKKTEANLAYVTGYDPRTCRRWLADDTEPPAEALGVVLAEIMKRFHQR